MTDKYIFSNSIKIESRAAQEDLKIAGYYAGAENFYENSLERLPGMRIADKVAELNSLAYIAVVRLYRT